MRVSRGFMSAMLGLNSNKNSTRRSRMMDRYNTNTANRFLGTQSANKTNSTQSNYLSMKENAGEVQSIASKLMDTGDESLFAKAEESGDTTAVTKQIKDFVNKYNGMVRNLKNSGGRVDNSYLNQLNANAKMYRSALQSTGVSQNADGTLSVNDKTLAGATVEQLKKAWGQGSFAAKTSSAAANVQSNAVNGMNNLIANSYSNLLRSYGSKGNYFNFWS